MGALGQEKSAVVERTSVGLDALKPCDRTSDLDVAREKAEV